MNTLSLIGRAARDPELRYTQDGKPIATFSVAVDKFTGKEKGADFITITCFGKTAELVDKYVAKGMMVGVSAEVHNNNWTDKDGKKVYGWTFAASKVEFLTRVEKPEKEEGSPIPGFSELNDDDVLF